MTDSSPQTITLPLPAIEGMTIAFQGVNYLRPEKMLDFATISPAPVRAVTPLARVTCRTEWLRRVGMSLLDAAWRRKSPKNWSACGNSTGSLKPVRPAQGVGESVLEWVARYKRSKSTRLNSSHT